MTIEELQQKYDELRMFGERLDDRIMKLEQKKEPEKILNIQQFEDIKFYPNLKVDNLFIKYIETVVADEPSILSNQIILWKDTTNTKYYIKSNFNGTAKKIELI